jgi:hypothetical protein
VQEAGRRRDFQGYTPKLVEALEERVAVDETMQAYKSLDGNDIIVGYCSCCDSSIAASVCVFGLPTERLVKHSDCCTFD